MQHGPILAMCPGSLQACGQLASQCLYISTPDLGKPLGKWWYRIEDIVEYIYISNNVIWKNLARNSSSHWINHKVLGARSLCGQLPWLFLEFFQVHQVLHNCRCGWNWWYNAARDDSIIPIVHIRYVTYPHDHPMIIPWYSTVTVSLHASPFQIISPEKKNTNQLRSPFTAQRRGWIHKWRDFSAITGWPYSYVEIQSVEEIQQQKDDFLNWNDEINHLSTAIHPSSILCG